MLGFRKEEGFPVSNFGTLVNVSVKTTKLVKIFGNLSEN